MSAVEEMLKATEAAVVSRVSLRDVNRVIDEEILPKTFVSLDNGRHVLAGACSLIAFYFESAKRLTSEERVLAIKAMEPRLTKSLPLAWAALLKEDWTLHDEFLTIDLLPFMRETKARINDLGAARDMVTESSEVLSGTPVIRGTRIPVYDVAASVAAGHPTNRILEAYPSLTEEMVRLATMYAEAIPPRGRPRGARSIPAGSNVITDRHVPRRRKAG